MDGRVRASTNGLLYGSITESIVREDIAHHNLLLRNKANSYSYPPLQSPKYIKRTETHRHQTVTHLEWLSDATSFVSVTEDYGMRLFIAPPDLLQSDSQDLVPFIRVFHHTPISAFALHPSASLYDAFCGTLVASDNLPLKMINLISEDGKSQIIKTFNVQDAQTEKFNKIYSAEFSSDSQFLTGSNNFVQVFDINRSNPVLRIPTTNGITSCITPSRSDFLPDGSFYTGSFNKKVQVHDSNGEVINSVILDQGNGITQIIESINGRYLFCISRNSSSIQILDLRMDLLPVGELELFVSKNQRIKGDIFKNSKGLIIGSSNGYLNWYKDAELGLTCINPIQQQIIPQTSIPSVSINPDVSNLILTSQGERSHNQPKVDIIELNG